MTAFITSAYRSQLSDDIVHCHIICRCLEECLNALSNKTFKLSKTLLVRPKQSQKYQCLDTLHGGGPGAWQTTVLSLQWSFLHYTVDQHLDEASSWNSSMIQALRKDYWWGPLNILLAKPQNRNFHWSLELFSGTNICKPCNEKAILFYIQFLKD